MNEYYISFRVFEEFLLKVLPNWFMFINETQTSYHLTSSNIFLPPVVSRISFSKYPSKIKLIESKIEIKKPNTNLGRMSQIA